LREGEVLTPLDGLSRNLTQATERLLQALREHLEGAGVSPTGDTCT
jgi:hypothetical protein